MNSLWSITAEDYLNVVKICQELGMEPGSDMTPVFVAYMEQKGVKPFAHNEFTKEELISHLTEQTGNILKINTDDKGKQSIELHKKKEK